MAEFIIMPIRQDPPAAWARAREREGWHGIGVGDHWFVPGVSGINHPFVALGAMATATSTVSMTTLFVNNLMHSPVEVALAATTVHAISNGRFELGLGAGWAKAELEMAGIPFPSPRERARRFFESVQIIRALFAGSCRFEGEYYTVNYEAVGPTVASPPRLAAALGGAWTMDHIGPLVDTIEIATMGPAFRDGENDFAAFARMKTSDLQALIDRARAVNPAARVGVSMYTASGSGRGVDAFAQMFEGSAFDGMAGTPSRVADALHHVADLAVDRVTVMPVTGDPAELAAALFG